jgi:hypothetical protein
MDCEECQAQSVFNFEFFFDVLAMCLDGFDADLEFLADYARRNSLSDQFEDLFFASREPVDGSNALIHWILDIPLQ